VQAHSIIFEYESSGNSQMMKKAGVLHILGRRFMPKTTGNKYIAEFMKAAGTTHFFYVPVLFPDSIKHMTSLGITPVVAHSEKSAAYMADGYARVAGRPGLCGAQHIGGSNLAAAMRDPLMAKVPVIAITGSAFHNTRYKGLYQDIDDNPAFASLTKWSATVELASRIPDMLDKAYRIACSGRPGPVHLELPGFWGALATEEIEAPDPVYNSKYALGAFRPLPNPDELKQAVARISKAKKPVLVAGTGAIQSGAGMAIEKFCEKLSIPIATATAAKALTVDDHPLLLGVCGEYSRECVNMAISESDLVIFVGSNTGGLVTRNWSIPSPDKAVIQIDLDSRDMGRNYPDTLGLVGDAKVTIEALTEIATAQTRPDWLAQVKKLRDEWEAHTAPLEASNVIPMRPERLCRELSSVLPDNAILCVDTGHAPGWVARNVRLKSRNQSVIRAAGSLGWGFPAGIGAKAAAPDRPVVTFTGDGGFYYHLQEIETAERYGLPTVTILNNNMSLNQERFIWEPHQEYAKNWRFSDVDFVKVAEGFGAWAKRVDDPAHLADAIRDALACGKTAVIDARTDDRYVVPSSWGPGSGNPYRSE
jgi:acetolactate synthase I/II/III large subunit